MSTTSDGIPGGGGGRSKFWAPECECPNGKCGQPICPTASVRNMASALKATGDVTYRTATPGAWVVDRSETAAKIRRDRRIRAVVSVAMVVLVLWLSAMSYYGGKAVRTNEVLGRCPIPAREVKR